MKYLNVSKARARIADLAADTEPTALTSNGEPVAVLMPIREYRATVAMLKLAAHRALMEQVTSVHDKVQRGELDDFVELDLDAGPAAVRRADAAETVR